MVYCTTCNVKSIFAYSGTDWLNLVNGLVDDAVVPTVTSSTGRIWMDRNLGATQVATSSTDAASYGDLYQWGRSKDGHQIRTSATTSTLSSGDKPGNPNFILNGGDWRSPSSDTLWEGVNSTNNPCPVGFRLPNTAELNEERAAFGTQNAAGAFNSALKLSLAGYREHGDGVLKSEGFVGNYWSSSLDGGNAIFVNVTGSTSSMLSNRRGFGWSVRCIKD
jgi:uncharacterized protein (TIGR02145 family)